MPKRTAHEFGRYLRQCRVDANVSLRAAARAIGVSAVYLGEVERGVRPPLREEHWDAVLRAVPLVRREKLERFSVRSKPVQLDLRNAPPAYRDLGAALARRIDRRNLSQTELERLMSILERENE